MFSITIKRPGFDTIIAEMSQLITVGELLSSRNIPTDGMVIKVNGDTVNNNYELTEDAEVRVLKTVAGA